MYLFVSLFWSFSEPSLVALRMRFVFCPITATWTFLYKGCERQFWVWARKKNGSLGKGQLRSFLASSVGCQSWVWGRRNPISWLMCAWGGSTPLGNTPLAALQRRLCSLANTPKRFYPLNRVSLLVLSDKTAFVLMTPSRWRITSSAFEYQEKLDWIR